MQILFAFKVVTILSCGRDLNLVHAYKGCLSLHTTQLLTGSEVLVVKDATGLDDVDGFLPSPLGSLLPGSDIDVSDA